MPVSLHLSVKARAVAEETQLEGEAEGHQSTLPLTPLGHTSSVRGMVPVAERKWSVRWDNEIQFPGLVQSIITLSQS